MLTKKERELVDALEPKAMQEGMQLISVEITGAKKSPTIRVYIDTPTGVSFDELAKSQVWINQIMEDIDPFTGAYVLEVSSPGIDRPLRLLEHFKDQIGQTVVVLTEKAVQDRSRFSAILHDVVVYPAQTNMALEEQSEQIAEDGEIVLDIEGQFITIAYSNIKRARLKGKVVFK